MRLFASLLAAVTLFASTQAMAGSLQVSPLSLDLGVGNGATVLTVRNDGARAMSAEVRVYKWIQNDGKEQLVAATDVVASPPVVQIQPAKDYSVRILRLAHDAITAEGAYRVIVSELPDPARRAAGSIEMLVSHSVPLFVKPAEVTPPDLAFSARVSGGRMVLTATNTGGLHSKISSLRVNGNGGTVSFGNGLLGYALSRSSMTWQRPTPKGFAGGPLRLTAEVDGSPFDASVETDR